MKRIFPSLVLVCLAFLGGRLTVHAPADRVPPAPVPSPESATRVSAGSRVAVHFSPHGGCTEAILRELNAAREEILVQAYSFTSPPIAAALRDAHRRGVKVIAVLDSSNRTAKYSGATFLANAGIPVYIDDRHAIAHNKVMVVDSQTVITGSFNFTRAAEEKNAENLIILRDVPEVVQAYKENFEAHLAHSEPYRRRSL